MITIAAPTETDTRRLGARLGALAPPGTVVALVGDLGAGKTVFAKGVGEGLGVPSRIQSPTFVLLASHPGGRLHLWHADLYRLGDASEVEELGLDEVIEGEDVVLIEWAERFPEILPADHLEVRIAEAPGEGRHVEIEGRGPRHRALEAALAA